MESRAKPRLQVHPSESLLPQERNWAPLPEGDGKSSCAGPLGLPVTLAGSTQVCEPAPCSPRAASRPAPCRSLHSAAGNPVLPEPRAMDGSASYISACSTPSCPNILSRHHSPSRSQASSLGWPLTPAVSHSHTDVFYFLTIHYTHPIFIPHCLHTVIP